MCLWYKSNFSPFLVVSLVVNSHSKNARFNLRFPIRLISLQGLSQTPLHSSATLNTLPLLVKTCHTFHMSQQSRATPLTASWEESPAMLLQTQSRSIRQDAQRNAVLVNVIIRRFQQAALELELTRSGKVTSGEVFTGTNSNSPEYLVSIRKTAGSLCSALK